MATPPRPRPATPRRGTSRTKWISWPRVRMVFWIVGLLIILGWIFVAGRQSAGLGVSQIPPPPPPMIPFLAPPLPPTPNVLSPQQPPDQDAQLAADYAAAVRRGEVP